MIVPQPVWDYLKSVAEGRDQQKHDYASSRYWNPESHFHGLLGEWAYGIMIGEQPNYELIAKGDDGYDFGNVDVKTSTHPDPDLKVTASNPFTLYVLMHLIVSGRQVIYKGWAFDRDFHDPTRARVVDYGYGPRVVIHWSNLRPGMPT